MSNNTSRYDFENICRTCLSTDDLKPLYEKRFASSTSTCLVEMLMYCTFVKFAEDDGLPVKICLKCINEINQAFLFVKRCETTDTILQKYVRNKLPNNPCESQTIESIIKTEIITPDLNQTTENIFAEYKYVNEIKEENYVEIENVDIKQEDVQSEYDEYLEKSYQVEDVKIENENDNPADESYEQDVDEDKDGTCSEKADEPNTVFLDSHVKNLKSKKSNICSVCNKKFNYSYHLKKHMSIHIGEKPYSCGVCNKGFTYRGNLKTHARIHTGEKPYSCGVCGKGFTQQATLQKHARIHTEQKSYRCSVCSKNFVTSDTLAFHMRIHTGEKPYSCSVCSKSFAQHTTLTNHSRIHTGEKPYNCSVCNKSFAQLTNLQMHARIHTGEKPYSCDICNKDFAHHSSFKKHKRIHTEEKLLGARFLLRRTAP